MEKITPERTRETLMGTGGGKNLFDALHDALHHDPHVSSFSLKIDSLRLSIEIFYTIFPLNNYCQFDFFGGLF